MKKLKTALRRLLDIQQDTQMNEAELADLGLSGADVLALETGVPGARARMEMMAAQFGISATDMDRDRSTALDLAKTCAQCGEAHRCMRSIEAGVPLDEARCPNVKSYRLLANSTTAGTFSRA